MSKRTEALAKSVIAKIVVMQNWQGNEDDVTPILMRIEEQVQTFIDAKVKVCREAGIDEDVIGFLLKTDEEINEDLKASGFTDQDLADIGRRSKEIAERVLRQT